ncbi:MAG: TadE/TadG family type IV pilus assembly protein [Gaiellaceae bacterium]
MPRTTNKLKNERGQTMTELALVLPILVVLVLAIAQFGVAFNNYVTLTDAARAGARKAAVSRNASDPASDCVNAVRNAAGDLNLSNLTVSCSSSWGIGSDVTVTATYPYEISLLDWVVKSGSLTTTMKERVE